MNADQRQIRRMLVLAQSRPEPPVGLALTGSRLSWEEPPQKAGVTHYLIRVGSDAGAPRYKVPVGQTSCVLAGGDSSFWVSSYNEASQAESAQVHVTGTAAGAGSGDSIGNVTGLSALAEDAGEGTLRITMSGSLPTDSLLQGLVFVLERPAPGDAHPDDPTLPGVIQVDAHEWYCAGDGSDFQISFECPKPVDAEKWIIYALSFGAGAANYLKRLTQFSPPLPADVTPYAVVDLSSVLTLVGSGLGDVTITGTPTLTPTGYGTLKIDLLYIPPYVSGPAISIGDFQGVTAFVELADGSVKSYGDFPYLSNPLATPPDNLGSVSLSIPMPAPQTIYVQLCAYSTTARLPYKSHATAPSSRWVAIVISSATTGGGAATQVGSFAVAVETETLSGVSAGGKQGRFKVTFTKPVDDKWKSVLLERIPCDSSYVPLAGAAWGRLTETTESPEYFGWWPWPTVVEYWKFRARSVNFSDIPNDVAYPTYSLSLAADGAFTLANDAVAAAMLQDLAVTARTMADAAIGRPGVFAPLVVENAAIGIGAIHNANIYSLIVDKITIPAAGSVTISAGGSFTMQGDGGAAAITLMAGGFSSISGGINIAGGGSWSGAPLLGGGAYFGLSNYIGGSGDAHLYSMALDVALPVTEGGTGATDAAGARSNLGLGTAATANIGTGIGDVASSSHDHDGAYAAMSHPHSWADITSGTQPAPPAHSHYMGDISDWPTTATGTYSNPTSITVQSGLITAIS